MDGPPGAFFACGRCSARLGASARFCSACGAPAVEPTPLPPPLDRWRELRAALQMWVALVACSGGLGVVHTLTGSDSGLFDLVGTIAMALVVLGFAASMPGEIARLLRPRALGRRTLALSAAACVALLVFIHLYSAALSRLGFEYARDAESLAARWPVWAVFAIAAACPAVFEEIAFRGFLYRKLERVGGPREALIVQAAMFSVLHLLPAVFASHFAIGLVLGWLRQKTDSLLPGMLVHGAYNGTLIALELWA